MCGIYGIVGNTGSTETRLTLARALCVENIERGDHSAGIATVSNSFGTAVHRKAVKPTVFARSKRFAELASADYRVLIGHTRFATHGTISDENAHPFRSGATIGIHNGMVANVEGMRKYTGKTFPVDSQYLIYCLDQFGHLGPAQGSLNVAYFGAKGSADLRLIRWGNPLSCAFLNNGKAFAFSSSWKHLRKAMSIAGLKGDIQELEDGALTSVYLGAGGEITLEFGDVPFLPDAESSEYWEPKTYSFLRNCDSGRRSVHELTDAEWLAEMEDLDARNRAKSAEQRSFTEAWNEYCADDDIKTDRKRHGKGGR